MLHFKLNILIFTQTKFSTRCKAWNAVSCNSETSPCIALRFEEQLNLPTDLNAVIDRKSLPNLFERHLHVRVNNFKLPSIQMSTIIGLNDLLEEEIIPLPVPMNIELEGVNINIIEDRPPVNITSPGAQPINLKIGKMKILRENSGAFIIQPSEHGTKSGDEDENLAEDVTKKMQKKDRERELLSLQLVMKQLKVDNEQLRQQLMIAERNVECGRQKIKQENEILKSYLKAAQDDVATLLDEKRTLMDTIKSLQVSNFFI